MIDSRLQQSEIIPVANPFVGLVSVITGMVLAIAFVPMDHRPEGALFASALCMIIGLLFAPGMAVVMSPISAFRVEHLLMLGLAYWLLLDHIQGVYEMDEVGRPAVVWTFLAIGLFAAAVWVSACQPPWQLPGPLIRASRVELGPILIFGAIVVCASLTMFRFAWPCEFDYELMISSLAGDRWSAPWQRSALGDWSSFIDHLTYFGYLLPTLVVLLAQRMRGWRNTLVWLSIFLTLVCAVFIAHGGSRRVIGVMFGSSMICWALLRGRAIRLTTLAGLAGAAAVLLFAMQIMLEFRGRGYGDLLEQEARQERHYDHLHVDDNFLRLAQVIEIVPDKHPFTHEKMLIWVAIRPIPRVLWEGKPTDPGFDLTRAVGKRNVSLTCSAMGELYISFGWPAIAIGGWLFGRLGGTCNRFLMIGSRPAGFLLYSTGTMAVFTGLRSLIELVLMSYMLIAWCGVVAIFHFFGYGLDTSTATVRAAEAR